MLIKIYPENPNPKEVGKVVATLRDGGLAASKGLTRRRVTSPSSATTFRTSASMPK